MRACQTLGSGANRRRGCSRQYPGCRNGCPANRGSHPPHWRTEYLRATLCANRPDHKLAGRRCQVDATLRRTDTHSRWIGRVEASGSLAVDSGQYTVEAAGTNLRLDAPLPGGQSLTGVFKLSATGEGTLADPCLTAEVTGSAVKFGNREIGALTVNVEAGNRQGAFASPPPG